MYVDPDRNYYTVVVCIGRTFVWSIKRTSLRFLILNIAIRQLK